MIDEYGPYVQMGTLAEQMATRYQMDANLELESHLSHYMDEVEVNIAADRFDHVGFMNKIRGRLTMTLATAAEPRRRVPARHCGRASRAHRSTFARCGGGRHLTKCSDRLVLSARGRSISTLISEARPVRQSGWNRGPLRGGRDNEIARTEAQKRPSQQGADRAESKSVCQLSDIFRFSNRCQVNQSSDEGLFPSFPDRRICVVSCATIDQSKNFPNMPPAEQHITEKAGDLERPC